MPLLLYLCRCGIHNSQEESDGAEKEDSTVHSPTSALGFGF